VRRAGNEEVVRVVRSLVMCVFMSLRRLLLTAVLQAVHEADGKQLDVPLPRS
jgi:hypothetical protein